MQQKRHYPRNKTNKSSYFLNDHASSIKKACEITNLPILSAEPWQNSLKITSDSRYLTQKTKEMSV